MKKNNWTLIIVLVIIYSALFYHQNAGLNFLIFSIVLCSAIFLRNRLVFKTKKNILYALAGILTGAFTVIHPSDLAIFANMVSLSLLSAVAVNSRSSVFLNFISGIYSIVGSFVFMILEAIHNFRTEKSSEEKGRGQKALVYFTTGMIILIFIAIYKSINPLFEKYTQDLNLDFLEPEWMLFTFGGLLLVYAFVIPQRINPLDDWEIHQEKTLSDSSENTFNKNQKQALVFLFAALNLMLLVINLLDINYLYLGKGLPEGITHKQFVHNGVGMLTFSILLGIGIILFAFRGSLNFDTKNKVIKFLVYAWLIQNLLMVISTGMRNGLYIHEALLTYKRIGVYYWLVLAGVGIATTLIKIHKIKPNWYLLRSNSFVAYLILVGSAGVDWDNMISDFNFSRIKDIASLDKKYLISLSEGNLKLLYSIKQHPKFEIDSVYHYRYLNFSSNKKDLDKKLFCFLLENENKDWRSFDLRTKKVMEEVTKMNEQGTIDTLDLSSCDTRHLSCLLPLTKLKELQLSYLNNLDDHTIKEINQFKNLETLRLGLANLKDTAQLYKFEHLKTLYLKNPLYSKSDSIELSHKKLHYRLILVK